MTWTDERIENLKKLWNEGLTASQVAARLGPDVSRNAVLSKIHRLGASNRKGSRSTECGTRRAPRYTRPKAVRAQRPPHMTPKARVAAVFEDVPYVPQDEVLVVPLHERKRLVDLDENDCRWPIGDPQHDDFHFCNRSKVAGLPYCEHHARVAYPSPVAYRKAPQEQEKHNSTSELVDA